MPIAPADGPQISPIVMDRIAARNLDRRCSRLKKMARISFAPVRQRATLRSVTVAIRIRTRIHFRLR